MTNGKDPALALDMLVLVLSISLLGLLRGREFIRDRQTQSLLANYKENTPHGSCPAPLETKVETDDLLVIEGKSPEVSELGFSNCMRKGINTPSSDKTQIWL